MKDGDAMTYPKPIMTSSELMALGFTSWQLCILAHREGQTYARRLPGGKKIYWDTEKLEKALAKHAVR